MARRNGDGLFAGVAFVAFLVWLVYVGLIITGLYFGVVWLSQHV